MRTLPLAFALGLSLVACSGGEDATSSGAGGAGTGTGGAATHLTPDPQLVPKATGVCPDFTSGKNTFAPAGINPRDVLLWLTAGAEGGPLVFFWHGTGGDPSEATYVLGDKALKEIQAQGGLMAAPYHDDVPGLALPWYLSAGGAAEDDLLLADEIVACAIEKKKIDLRRIHSVGFSAGAMHTEQFLARRSGYLASAVPYSGAQVGEPPVQDERNKYPAMIVYGGPNDAVGANFDDAAHAYREWMTSNGHFSFLCNHGKGHTVPADARDSAWQFLQDHPFGASPEPYEEALPAGFPSYCSLTAP